MTKSLPDYERPPVVETVLGVQFEPLPKMRNAHLGAFWRTLPSEWNSIEDAPSLEPQSEIFSDAPDWGGLRFRLTQDLSSRLQIRNETGNRMIQVQNGRLHINWLGHDNNEYVRYRQVKADFDSILKQLECFVVQEGLGDLRPNQWEVTYINRIPRGTVWETPEDWTFFHPLGDVTRLSSVKLESFGGEWHYEIPARRGRLHIQFQHVRKPGQSPDESIVINLTARGGVGGDENVTNWSNGLDVGHETIVTTFKEIMSDSANQFWGLKNGNRSD